ncbi:hypothetical protein PGT21_036584 [Puccinia graminis f. sp. tritici]|uniref:Uncharacterized protein n=1 Tax=Puccinia graminis f. sp. tritici TaxID=56615 RepID=A0A5B0QCX4_PUCGR|nr:hypothetical protein PGT21_036584 [Puccinia graminis f. sp. tritici]
MKPPIPVDLLCRERCSYSAPHILQEFPTQSYLASSRILESWLAWPPPPAMLDIASHLPPM